MNKCLYDNPNHFANLVEDETLSFDNESGHVIHFLASEIYHVPSSL